MCVGQPEESGDVDLRIGRSDDPAEEGPGAFEVPRIGGGLTGLEHRLGGDGIEGPDHARIGAGHGGRVAHWRGV